MSVILLFSITGFFLWFCGDGILNLFYPQDPYSSFLIAFSVFTLLWSLIFLGQSWIGIQILRVIKGARPLIEKENSRLKELTASVQHEIFLKTGLEPLSLDIYFEESPLPMIWAVGRKTLFMSRTLYEMTTDKELKGLIAAELASLHRGDAQRRFCTLVLGFIPLSFAWSLKMGGKALCEMSLSMAPKQKEALPFVAVQVITLLMGFFLILGWGFTKIAFGILSLLSWAPHHRQIFKSDLFAQDVGFGEGLLSFLHKIKNFDFDQSDRLNDRFSDTAPKIMIRIGRLEKGLKNSHLSSF